MNYSVGVLGANGRMGQLVCASLKAGHFKGDDVLELAQSVTRIPQTHSQTSPHSSIDVWIDFSAPEATLSLLERISEPIVIGTTGFDERQMEKILAYARRHPVLLSPNMSMGMSLMGQLVSSVPVKLKDYFDVFIHEEHHRGKKDAPSGSAKMLAKTLLRWNGVPISSVRAGGIRGVHRVKFVADNEEIEITHRALDRKIFAEGALQAAHFLLHAKEAGLYSMKQVLTEGIADEF